MVLIIVAVNNYIYDTIAKSILLKGLFDSLVIYLPQYYITLALTNRIIIILRAYMNGFNFYGYFFVYGTNTEIISTLIFHIYSLERLHIFLFHGRIYG